MINHSGTGVMFTNLAIVWGPHMVVVELETNIHKSCLTAMRENKQCVQ